MGNDNPQYGVKCASCKDVIFSDYRHDFKYCSCGNTFVDGGLDYLRYGGEPMPQTISRTAYKKDQVKLFKKALKMGKKK